MPRSVRVRTTRAGALTLEAFRREAPLDAIIPERSTPMTISLCNSPIQGRAGRRLRGAGRRLWQPRLQQRRLGGIRPGRDQLRHVEEGHDHHVGHRELTGPLEGAERPDRPVREEVPERDGRPHGQELLRLHGDDQAGRASSRRTRQPRPGNAGLGRRDAREGPPDRALADGLAKSYGWNSWFGSKRGAEPLRRTVDCEHWARGRGEIAEKAEVVGVFGQQGQCSHGSGFRS